MDFKLLSRLYFLFSFLLSGNVFGLNFPEQEIQNVKKDIQFIKQYSNGIKGVFRGTWQPYNHIRTLKLLEKAEKSRQIKNWHQAITYTLQFLQNSKQQKPQNIAKAHHILTESYLFTGKIRPAVRHLRNALRIALTLKSVAKNHYLSTIVRWSSSINQFKKPYGSLVSSLFQVFNDASNIHIFVVPILDKLRKSGYPKKSIYLGELILQESKIDSKAKAAILFSIATSNIQLSNWQESIKYLKRSAALPNLDSKFSANVYLSIARVAFHLKKYDEAEYYYLTSLNFEDKKPNPLFELIMVNLKKGNYKAASDYAFEFQNKFPSSLLNKTKDLSMPIVYLNLFEFEKAIALINSLIAKIEENRNWLKYNIKNAEVIDEQRWFKLYKLLKPYGKMNFYVKQTVANLRHINDRMERVNNIKKSTDSMISDLLIRGHEQLAPYENNKSESIKKLVEISISSGSKIANLQRILLEYEDEMASTTLKNLAERRSKLALERVKFKRRFDVLQYYYHAKRIQFKAFNLNNKLNSTLANLNGLSNGSHLLGANNATTKQRIASVLEKRRQLDAIIRTLSSERMKKISSELHYSEHEKYLTQYSLFLRQEKILASRFLVKNENAYSKIISKDLETLWEDWEKSQEVLHRLIASSKQSFQNEIDQSIDRINIQSAKSRVIISNLKALKKQQLKNAEAAKLTTFQYYDRMLEEHLAQLAQWQADIHWFRLAARNKRMLQKTNSINWRRNSVFAKRIDVFLGLSREM